MSLELPSGLPWVSLDTETSGLHPDDGARVACVALAHGGWSVGLPFDQGVQDKLPSAQISLDLFGNDEDPNLPAEDWAYLLRWLLDQSIVMQNGKFDCMMMKAGTRHWEGVELIDNLVWDTMLATGVIEPRELRGLDATARRHGLGEKTGLDAVKGWLKAQKHPPNRYDLAPWDVIEPYVTADAVMTAEIKEWQDSQATPEQRKFIDAEMRLTRALYAMESRGIVYDDDQSLSAAERLAAVAEEIEDRMPFKCTPSEAHGYFFGQMKLDADRVSDITGRPSLDEEQVRKWVKEDVPWASEYSLVTRARRAVSMWYQGYPDKIGTDGRLRCVYRQGHVKSGRMSVERVQLQALPKKDKYNAIGSDDKLSIFEGVPGVRELISAPDGYGLWNLDLSQAELRVAANYSQCSFMLQELASDDPDIHGKTCRNVMSVDPADPQWKFKRDIAKRLTFGGIFMVGAETFQATLAKLADIHMPLSECDALVRGWRRMYPEIEIAYRRAERKASRDGFVRLLPNTEWEVRSYFNPDRDWPRTGWNRMVQGSLARAFGLWLGEIEERWPGYMVLTVHDSVVLEAPLDEGDQVAGEVATFGHELFSDLFKIDMPVDVDRW